MNPNIADCNLREQFKHLIVEPLRTLPEGGDPILLVIDAVDECEKKGAETILFLFAEHVAHIPRLKVLITARPEQHIEGVLGPHHPRKQFRLHDIEDDIVQDDIRLYIEHILSRSQVRRQLPRLHLDWEPTREEADMLVDMSGKLFIIATTTAKFILDPQQMNPPKQLTILCHSRQNTSRPEYNYMKIIRAILRHDVSRKDFSDTEYNDKVMDLTYIKIIRAAAPRHRYHDWVSQFRACVGTIVLLHDPLPRDSLAVIIKLDADEIDRTLSNLHSLLAPSGTGFRVHHKSFPDFISNSSRCPEFFIDQKAHHLQMAKRCLHIMHDGLRENLCDLDPSEWNKDRAEIYHRIENRILPHLAYACTHWASHLDAALLGGADLDSEGKQLLERFATKHLLMWLEALSLIGRVDMAYRSLTVARKAVQQSGFTGWLNSIVRTWHDFALPYMRMWVGDATISTMEAVEEILSDGCKLVQRSRAILKALPMHTYHSILPFTPSASALFRTYKGSHSSNMDVIGGVVTTWDAAIAALNHTSYVQSIEFSPDGSRLASVCFDAVRLWDHRTGNHIATLEGHSEGVRHAKFSPDGSILVSGYHDGTVWLWNGRTGNYITTLEALHGVFGFSPDGSRLATIFSDGLRFWDVGTWDYITTLDAGVNINQDLYTRFQSAPEGPGLVTSTMNGLHLWDWRTGNHIASAQVAFSGVGYFYCTFSPDGSRFVFPSTNQLCLWDGRTGNHIATLEGPFGPAHHFGKPLTNSLALQFSPSGSSLVVATENGLRVYDSRTGNHIATYEGNPRPGSIFTFSRDGSRFAVASSDDSVWLRDGGMNNHITTLNAQNVTHLEFSPDGSTLASASTEMIHLWDGKTGKHVTSFIPGSQRAMTFSPDGTRLASISGTSVWLWDTEMKAHHTSPKGHPLIVQSFEFSPDSSQLALVHKNNTVEIWSRWVGSPVMLDGHFKCVKFSPDGARLALASSDKVVLLDGKTGNHIGALAGQFAYGLPELPTPTQPRARGQAALTFSLDGSQLAMARSGGVVHLWDAREGNLMANLSGHSESVLSIAFSPDGSRLATASSDETARLWHVDSRNGSHIATLTGHSGEVTYITFSPDGLRLVSVDCNGLVQLWDGLTGCYIASWRPYHDLIHDNACLVAFSSDGLRLALGNTACKCISVLLLDGRTGDHITDLQRGEEGGLIYRPKSLAFYQNDSRFAAVSRDEMVLWDITDTARPSMLCRKTAVNMFILHNHDCLFLLEERRQLALWGLTVLDLAHTNSFDTQVICWFSPDISPSSLTVDPDGSTAVVQCEDDRLLILDISKFPML